MMLEHMDSFLMPLKHLLCYPQYFKSYSLYVVKMVNFIKNKSLKVCVCVCSFLINK